HGAKKGPDFRDEERESCLALVTCKRDFQGAAQLSQTLRGNGRVIECFEDFRKIEALDVTVFVKNILHFGIWI
ncbi:MAG TPA: hypothetical protein VGE83_00445, partial [Terracidiphilus sp.]